MTGSTGGPIFYWAWWISWTPFVGMFLARIARGRTIRQFVIYVILMPQLVRSRVVSSIMGGAAHDLQLHKGVPLDKVSGRSGDPKSVLLRMLRGSPLLASITVVLAILLIAIFFITGADSASIVMGSAPSQHGKEETKRWLSVVLGCGPGRRRLGAAVVRWRLI